MNRDFTDNTMLIIDDEPFVLSTTAYQVRQLGFQNVLTAESVDRALEALATAQPPVTLVMSDLNMPGVDGVDLLRRFDELGYQGDIILFSGEDVQTLNMAKNLAEARNLSVLGVITKPIQLAELSRLLNTIPEKPRQAKLKPVQKVSAGMLEAAIEAAEFEPWFQPKIDIARRTPIGVEVLARWPNASQGPVYPDAFIPVAEKNGLIDRLTLLLVEKATHMAASWRGQGIDLKLAFNVSMESLNNLKLPDLLVERLRCSGKALDHFQLEVTESRLMDDCVAPLDVLLRLRMKKISLSIDDFGTGHSNLSQLRDLPFDELKLDRSYVQASLHDERILAILESSIDMAKKLNMTLVAEGVETLEEWRQVERLGCDQVQGYLTARPMPGAEIPDWFRGWPERCRELFGTAPAT